LKLYAQAMAGPQPVLGKAVERANESLADSRLVALPEGLTLHALRRTFASVLVALGRDPAYVMGQMGHTDPTLTLGLYARVMSATDDDRKRLRELVAGGAEHLVVDQARQRLQTTL
jgi:integrase